MRWTWVLSTVFLLSSACAHDGKTVNVTGHPARTVVPPPPGAYLLPLDADNYADFCIQMPPDDPVRHRCVFVKEIRQYVESLRAN